MQKQHNEIAKLKDKKKPKFAYHILIYGSITAGDGVFLIQRLWVFVGAHLFNVWNAGMFKLSICK